MILIASHSQEFVVTQPVVKLLQARGEEVLVYQADKVASGKIRAGFKLDSEARPTFIYGDLEFSPDEVEAAWYRQPNVFGPEELNKVFLIYLDKERKECQDSLWYSISSERWLVSPEKIGSSYKDKLVQLRLAHECGFITPRTVIGNNWEDAFHSLNAEEVIVKLPNGRLYIEEEARFLTSTIINKEKYESIKHTLPFPGIWQEYIPKKKEWRVTVVGSKVISAAIYTSSKARADWRRHQFDKRTVRFKSEQLPTEVEQKCTAMLRRIGVHFGAFDLIEDEEGNLVFLEVNLNGQYQWLVDRLQLHIPEAIAEELVRIKKAVKSTRKIVKKARVSPESFNTEPAGQGYIDL